MRERSSPSLHEGVDAVWSGAVGYLRNEQQWVNIALLAAGLAVIWHSRLRERRHRREHPQAQETRALGQQDA